MKIVECVPNFSEGRDLKIIDQITDVIKSVKGAFLLDVDPGADTNRTVVTFVGDPDSAIEAAFQAIKKASEIIDMSKHHGAHARMGATDVCPFVPVSGVTMEDCVEYAHRLGKRVGEELGIPVYFYEYAATKPEWRNLAEVRKGEYEALPEKMKDPYWKPDFGPQKFNPKTGATAISAREFLIAYNINLNTRDKKKAHDLALTIREAGRFKRDKNNKFVILEKVRELAIEKGIQVTGSELVGLIPKEAILNSGKFYLKRLGESAGLPEKMIIETAVQSMGLDDLTPFDINEKVIEYAIAEKDNLINKTLTDFADELSTDSPAPGGGSVAALCSAMSRNDAIQKATKNAIMVPLETLKIALEAAQLAGKIGKIGNENALSDAGVAAITANAAAKGAYLNVKINMGSIEDEKFKFDIMTQAEELLEKVDNLALKVEKEIKGKV